MKFIIWHKYNAINYIIAIGAQTHAGGPWQSSSTFVRCNLRWSIGFERQIAEVSAIRSCASKDIQGISPALLDYKIAVRWEIKNYQTSWQLLAILRRWTVEWFRSNMAFCTH